MKKHTKTTIVLLAILCLSAYTTNAQVSINTDGSTPDASAVLDVKSTNKGFLPPRVASVNDVSSPVAGLMVYDERNSCIRFHNGTDWSVCVGMSFSCGLPIDIDGNTYETIEVGTQCMMAENLNVGTRIDGSLDQTDNSIIEKYCYNDLPSRCDTFGGLYQWDEMMQYVTTEGVQGICPTGWHIPTDAELKTLEMSLGMSEAQADATGDRGTNEGSKLAGNELLWNSGNLEQNADFGTSGFDALPAGSRGQSGPNYFGNRYQNFFLWTSSEAPSSRAWSRTLYYYMATVGRGPWDTKPGGKSVRCFKD